MAAMTSKFNYECVIQYYTDQWYVLECIPNKQIPTSFPGPLWWNVRWKALAKAGCHMTKFSNIVGKFSLQYEAI